jgi:hypothetical protein
VQGIAGRFPGCPGGYLGLRRRGKAAGWSNSEEPRNQRSGMTAATHSAADITWIDSILFNNLRNHSSLGRDVVSTGRCQPERFRLA